MKKLKSILAVLMAVIIFVCSPMSAFADASIEGLIADMFGDGGAGNTTTIKHGCVTGNQGWLCYIVGSDGHVAFNPIFFYRTDGYISPKKCSTVQLTSRIDGIDFSSSRTDYPWPDAYYDSGNSYGMSNADAVRNWMIADSGNGTSNIFVIVNTYWGSAANAAFSGDDNYYFVMEPVFWHGTHKQTAGGEKTVTLTTADKTKIAKQFYERSLGASTWNNMNDSAKRDLINQKIKEIKSTYTIKVASGWTITGDYCGTVYNGARYESVHGGCFSGVTAYRNGAYPNSIKVARDYVSDGGYNWLKSAPHGGTIATNDIINYGYGIGVFWNKDPAGGFVPNTNQSIENYKPVSLYETKNYDHTNTYDISEAIPSSEHLTNEINVSSFVGDGNFLTTKEQTSSRIWTATCRYYYTVHDWYHIDDTWISEEKVGTTGDPSGYDSDKYNISANGTEYDVYRKAHWKNGDTQRRDIDAYNTYTYPITTSTYAFNASVKYQYIDKVPHIYTWQNTTVTNGSFGQAFYDKNNSTVPGEVKAVATLWNNGNGKSTLVTSSEAYPQVAYKGGPDHYSWSGNISGTSCNVATLNKGYNHADETAGYNFNSAVERCELGKVQELASKIQNGTKSRNDKLEINDTKAGKHTVLNDAWVTGCTVNAYRGSSTDGAYITTFGGADAATNAGYSGLLEKINTDLSASRVSGKQALEIPTEKANADFTTGMTVNWVNVFDDTSLYSLSAGATVGSNESIYKHVMRDGILPHHTGTLLGDEADGYPVRVHTPVESPIKIVNKNKEEAFEKTQLINGSSLNDTVDNQLLLDKKYYLEWDNEQWISAVYGETPSGYENIFDRYVTAKYMQFPFSVVYNNKLYQTDTTGYTEWIEVLRPGEVNTPWNSGVNTDNYESANHWQMTPFYIPTLASECGSINDDRWVNVKVSAINVGQRLGSKDTEVYMSDEATNINDLSDEDIASSLSQNSDKANYVAICDKKIQLSGWVYDFSIVGNTNLAVYTGEGLEDIDLYRNIWPMARDKMELKTGPKDRLGNNYIRFLTDGSVSNSLDERQLLPLRTGSSYKFSKMGEIWRGQDFAFTIKTIANLDRMTDSIEITPHYTYVKDDGTIISGENLCYIEIDKYAEDIPGEKSKVFHTYDPNDKDITNKWNRQYTLFDRMFRESYYDKEDVTDYHYADWVKRSVDNENEKNGALTFKTLVDEGEYINRDVGAWTISHIYLPAETRYISGEYEQLEQNEGLSGTALRKYEFNGYDVKAQELFKKSMQQWNGQFGVPINIRLLNTTGIPNFDIYDYLTELTQKNGYFRWDDEPFEPLKGKLIIGFDITVNKAFCEELGVFCDFGKDYSGYTITSKPYLKYNGAGGGGRDMWKVEGHLEDPTVPYDEDDVAIVDLSRSMNDYFEIGILNIN